MPHVLLNSNKCRSASKTTIHQQIQRAAFLHLRRTYLLLTCTAATHKQPLSTMTTRLLTNYILPLQSAVNLQGLLRLKAHTHTHSHMQINTLHLHNQKKEKRQRWILECIFAHLVPQCFMWVYLDDSQLNKVACFLLFFLNISLLPFQWWPMNHTS